MQKKLSIPIIISILLITVILSPLSCAETSTYDSTGTTIPIFDSEVSIEKDKEIEKPLNPGDSEEITLTIGYNLSADLLKGNLIYGRRITRLMLFGIKYFFKNLNPAPNAIINLSLENVPDWCTIELEKTDLEFSYKEGGGEEVLLTLSVNQSPPALDEAEIIIKASYDGLWTIKGATNSTTLSIVSSYRSNLGWETDTTKTIPPLKNTTIPINITNMGNGETNVQIEIENPPEKWNLTFDYTNITLDVDETQIVYLDVTPIKDFNEENIIINLIPTSTSDADVEDEYLKGTTVSLNLILKNDGSLKEEDEFPVIETIIAIIALIIIILFLIRLIRGREQE